jgi:hypothetical protein
VMHACMPGSPAWTKLALPQSWSAEENILTAGSRLFDLKRCMSP